MSKTMVLLAVILMDLLSGMEFDLFVPSFPELQALFGISSFWVEALLSVNFIGYCGSLVLVGSFADRYGRKLILLIGLSLFVFGSLLCVWAPSYIALLLGRFLQGVGVAAPAILSFLIIADSYPLARQQHLMAMLNGVMNIAVGLAPVLGSYIALYFHWRGNFFTLLGLGILVLMMTSLCLPAAKLPKRKKTSFFAGYVGVLKSRRVILLIVQIVFMCVPYWIFVGISPLLYMKTLGVSLTHFGYYQGVLALVFALGCFLLGSVLNRLEQKTWLGLSFLICILSLFTLGWATWVNTAEPLLITCAFLPFVIAQIIPSTILYPLCLNLMPEAKGQISALIQGSKLILCALGLQLVGFYYEESFQKIGLLMLGFMFISAVALLMVIVYWSFFERRVGKEGV